VVVPEHIRAEIKHHLDTYVEDGPEAKLFAPAQSGRHLNDQVFRRQFNAALAAIGRDGVRVHDLRHFAGTMTALTGATLAETMARLGHPPRLRCSTSRSRPAAPRRSPRA
jgi:integrase